MESAFRNVRENEAHITESDITMKSDNRFRKIALVGLVGATTVLAGCSEAKDIVVLNTCGVPIAVGNHNFDPGFWEILDEGEQVEMGVGGLNEALITVLPADAEQRANPVEVPLEDLEWSENNGIETADLDLAARSLCP